MSDDINPVTHERDLTRTHELTYEEAMALYDAGKQVRRRSWPNRYLFISQADTAAGISVYQVTDEDRAADDWHLYDE